MSASKDINEAKDYSSNSQKIIPSIFNNYLIPEHRIKKLGGNTAKNSTVKK